LSFGHYVYVSVLLFHGLIPHFGFNHVGSLFVTMSEFSCIMNDYELSLFSA
jgi:hypothetical protein